MIIFDLSMNVIDQVMREIDDAEEFIRIAIFQIHNQQLFDALKNKVYQGLNVEIFTLPLESIHENVRARVSQQINQLEQLGTKLHYCKWNIGDPERTSTAINRWYSFHGKFIVTDKSAISLSANLTDQQELDSILIFRNDTEKIKEYNDKFYQLVELFITPFGSFDGKIRSLILNSNYSDPLSLFELPRSIETTVLENHWIKDYPTELCPEDANIKDQLYICPFDIKGRNLISNIIKRAKEFIFISTESFTDLEIIN